MSDIDLNPDLDPEPETVGGGALIAGFALLAVTLYGRDPSGAFGAATADVQGAVYFLVLPALGLSAGVFAYAGGPYAGVPLFVFGSYLGVFGVGVTFGALVTTAPSAALVGVGVALVALAVTALVASLLRVAGAIGLGLPGDPPE